MRRELRAKLILWVISTNFKTAAMADMAKYFAEMATFLHTKLAEEDEGGNILYIASVSSLRVRDWT